MLQIFDLVFLIQLRYVNKISSLAEIITSQHGKLKRKDLKYVESILEGDTQYRTLLLIDGYDEYQRGMNHEIDEAIESGIGDCFLILTSRPGYVSKQVRDKMDGEVSIEGFSEENIVECSIMYLGNSNLSSLMLEQAAETGIYELLCVPIILLIVFIEKESLPKTRCALVSTIFELIMDRTTLKTVGCKSSELKNIDALLYTLGEFSINALQSGHQQLLLKKVNLYYMFC